jgi:peptide/nickel transport system ATP-binding protein
MSQNNILEVENLNVRFYTYSGVVEALDSVNLTIRKGEILGLVGETGCGKSVTSLSVMRLVPPPGKIEGGNIFFVAGSNRHSVLKMDDGSLRKMRGKDISMIFQEPRAYLNPVYNVEDQIAEVLLEHRKEEFLKAAIETLRKKRLGNLDKAKGDKAAADVEKIGKVSSTFEVNTYKRLARNPRSLAGRFLAKFSRQRYFKSEVRKEVVRILKSVEIPDPERVARMYPHELSGGMAQRVIIAMALACNPTLLIADEPTTNLDVTVQAQILNLIRQLKKNLNSSILYITHDLGVVAQLCDRVAVMYAGNIIEMTDVFEIFDKPLHPYAQALLESIPRPGQAFKSIRGLVPSMINPPKGCRFNDRCSYAMEICLKVKPPFFEASKDHYVACHLYGEESK